MRVEGELPEAAAEHASAAAKMVCAAQPSDLKISSTDL
jgi:hypothetical protein